MSFPRHGQYKPSGLKLLGDVPMHWERTALKYMGEYQNGYPFKPEDRASQGLPIIRISQLSGDTGPNLYDGTLDDRVFVQEGDLLFSWSATIDSFIWTGGPGWLNQHIFKVTPSGEAHKGFLFYVIKHIAPKLAEFDAHGSTMRHIKKESLGERIFVPSVDEQAKVSAFLDRETAKIDSLVEEQKRLIELLKEKRQAVISQVVTKGLKPNVPMKDSGAQWLGKVPAHWVVLPLKHVVNFKSGGTPDKTRREYWDGNVPWASAKDLKVDFLHDTADHVTETALAEGAATLVKAGTVLVVVRGMILARTFPVVTAMVSMAINQDLKAATSRAPSRDDWLAWLLRASSVETLSRLDEAGHGTKALRMDAWGEMRIAVPPSEEQERIASFLLAECERIDSLVSESDLAIALLAERRSSLISAAVTGKIDVRGLVPQPEAIAA